MLTNLLFVLTCLLSINATLGDVTFAPRTLSAPWSKRWDSNMEFFNYPMKVFFQNGTTGNFRSALIVQGDGDDGNKPINDIWASPDKGISWYLIAGVGRTESQRAFSPYDTSSFSPVLQRPATGIDNNGGIYRIGGRRNDGIRPQSVVFRSADGGLSWKNQGNVAGATPFWPPRDRASIITDNKNQIYILGGQFLNEGDITMTNTAWMSTDLGVHWQELPHTPWRARGSGVLLSYWSEPLGVNVLTHLTGWDGREGERGLTNEIWISANSANSWRRVRTNWGLGNPPFKPRDAANGEITQRGILVLVGGQYVWPNGTYEALNDIWASLDGGYQWGLCNEDLPLADRRDFFMAFDEQGYLFVAGGQDMTSGAKFNDVWRSTISFDNPNTVARECKLPMPACGPGIACLPDDPHTTFLSNGTVTCPRVRKCANLPEEFMDFNSVTVHAPWSARYWLNAEYLGKSISFTTTRGVTVTYNKPLIVHGGNVNTNDVWASNDHGKTWEIVAGQGAHSSQTSRSYWPARPFATSIVNQVTNQVIRVGGFVSGDAGTTVNDVWVTLDAKIWNKQPATNLPNRAQPHLVVDNAGKLYFSGGILSDGSTGKDLWSSNDNGATWTQLTDVLPWAVQRGRAKGFLLQDRLPHPTLGQKDILFAGTGWDGINVYNDIWASSDYGVNWSRITARAPFGARDAAGAEITEDGLMIVVGGYTDGTQQNDVWVSADGGYSWGACSTEAAWSDRREPTGLVDDEGHFYVMGGRSDAQAGAEIFNDVWRSVLSLDNYNAVARACNVKISSCGPGLLCWPGAPDTVITSTGVTCPAAESCGPPKPRSSSSSTGRGRSSSSSKKPTPQPDPDYCEEFPCEDECDPDPDINPECFWSSSSTGPAITTGSGLSMGVIVAIIAIILVAVLGGGYWYYKRRGSTDPMSSSSMELGKAHTQSNNINQSLLSDDQPSSDAPAAL